ncbi:MAG: glycoside hydrolase family 2 TIM barrel-domain containing protein [Chthoniobacteraceae bacterium]
MKSPLTSLVRLLSSTIVTALLVLPGTSSMAYADGAVVKISKAVDGSYLLLRNGQPFFIKGAGGSQKLGMLAQYGGNSIRTWGIEQMADKIDGKPILDRAQELGIAVTVGIWIGHERHGFNYSDPVRVNRQREDVRQAVRKYKGHPAVLIWGLGNEMEGPMSDGADPTIWKELNVLAGIIKEEDPNHPVMTVIAGASPSKVKEIIQYYPNIDILGVNAYSGASGAGKAVKDAGWKKPFVLTEFGPQGHWEVSKTKWGAPIEPSSRDKAGSYYATQTGVIADSKDICLGSYVFLWGQKQEVTSTWYGMFLKSGEKLPTVDAMVRAWTGAWPANRAPRISSFTSPLKEATVKANETTFAVVKAEDPEGDPLQYEWAVTEESKDLQVGGDTESEPPSLPECILTSDEGNVNLRIPSKPGAYRLFVTVRDGKGSASKDNIPFQVTQ